MRNIVKIMKMSVLEAEARKRAGALVRSHSPSLFLTVVRARARTGSRRQAMEARRKKGARD